MTRSFQRAILLAGMLALTVGILPRPSTAADFECILSWSDIPSSMRAKESELDERFPSGRRPAPSTCFNVLIKGEIESGDGAKFREILRTNHPFAQSVLLWSPGGLVEEAMEIGRIIRRELLKTDAPIDDTFPHPIGAGAVIDTRAIFNPGKTLYICNGETCHCENACFLIWAAGIERQGNALGLHRPYPYNSTRFANLPPDRASGLYRLLLGEIDSYLTEMEIPRRFAEIMVDTSSNDVRWVTQEEALSMQEPPSLAEWITAGCGGMSKEEYNATLELGRRVRQNNASQRDKLLYERLFKKDFEISGCKLKKMDNARDAIGQMDPGPLNETRKLAATEDKPTEATKSDAASVVASTLFGTTATVLAWGALLCTLQSLLAAPVMKIFARQVSLFRLAVIFGWATFRVLAVAVIAMIGVTLAKLDLPAGLNGLFSFMGMCAVGSLITHDLERYGVKRKFPGVGAKTVTSMLILSWIVVGVYWYFVGF